MIDSCRHTPQLQRVNSGFTLVELMISAGLIGLVLGIGSLIVGGEFRREQVNTVAIELAAWLEGVRSASQRQPSSNPCVVTFSTTTPISVGATLASVAPTSCSNEPSFTVRNISGAVTYAIALNPATPTTLTFTPRGTVSASTNTDLRIQLSGTSEMRCVRLTATVGLIRIGSGSSTANDCSSYIVF